MRRPVTMADGGVLYYTITSQEPFDVIGLPETVWSQ